MNTNWKVYATSAVVAAVVSFGFQLFEGRPQKETRQSEVLITPKTGIERQVQSRGEVYYDDYRTAGYVFAYFLSKDGALQGARLFRASEDSRGWLSVYHYLIEDDSDPTLHNKYDADGSIHFWRKSPVGVELEGKCREVMLKYSADHPTEVLPELKAVL